MESSSSSADPSGVAGVTGEMADLEILEMVGDLLNNDRALTNIADQLMGLDFANSAESPVGYGNSVMPKQEPEDHQHYNQQQQYLEQKLQNASISTPTEADQAKPATTTSVPRTSGKDMSVMWKSYHSVKEEETDDDNEDDDDGIIDEDESKPELGAGNLPLLNIGGASASESESAYSPSISPGGLSSPASSSDFIGTSPFSGYVSSENDCASTGRARSEASMSEEGTANGDKASPAQPCEICNCQASEYKYYGARSCQSCRAFFRRAVQKPGGYQSLKCRAAKKGGAGGAEIGRCRIDSQSWRSCRYCRFQKCLSAGMNPKWVLNDSEKRRRAERLEVIKKERVSEALLILYPHTGAACKQTNNVC